MIGIVGSEQIGDLSLVTGDLMNSNQIVREWSSAERPIRSTELHDAFDSRKWMLPIRPTLDSSNNLCIVKNPDGFDSENKTYQYQDGLRLIGTEATRLSSNVVALNSTSSGEYTTSNNNTSSIKEYLATGNEISIYKSKNNNGNIDLIETTFKNTDDYYDSNISINPFSSDTIIYGDIIGNYDYTNIVDFNDLYKKNPLTNIGAKATVLIEASNGNTVYRYGRSIDVFKNGWSSGINENIDDLVIIEFHKGILRVFPKNSEINECIIKSCIVEYGYI